MAPKGILMESSTDNAVADLEKAIGFRFSNRMIIDEALTHRSYLNESGEQGLKDNERLEFFGDSVLSFCISLELLQRFPESREGDLTKARSFLVNEKTLARCAGEICLGKYLRMGKGEIKSGGRMKPSILADAYEALLAAMYLDGGITPVHRLVQQQFTALLSAGIVTGTGRDAKTEFQELVQSLSGSTPSYRVKEIAGPDHARIFTVTVFVGEQEFGEGQGPSKKEAEQEAAGKGLTRLETLEAGKGD